MILPRGKQEMEPPEVGPGFFPQIMHRSQLQGDSYNEEIIQQGALDPLYSMTHSAEARAKVKVLGRGKKSNLMAQVIPIYGFGILLYIIFIIYKLTCKRTTTKTTNSGLVFKTLVQNRFTTEYELTELQERVLQTEAMMERIVSGKSSRSGRRRKSKMSTLKKEEKLFKQLQQFKFLMQDGRLEGASPEKEAEEVPYCADWEGYPEETYPEYDEPEQRLQYEMARLDEICKQPTAEALAERMEQVEEEVGPRKLSTVHEENEEDDEEEEGEEDDDYEDEAGGEELEVEDEDKAKEAEENMGEDKEEDEDEEIDAERRVLLSPRLSCPTGGRKQERLGLEVSREIQSHTGGKKISFSEHQDVFHYPREGRYELQRDTEEEEEDEEDDEVDEAEEDEEEEEEETEAEQEEEADEDDPVMEAESLLFRSDSCLNPEEEAEEEQEEEDLLASPVGGSGSHIGVTEEVAVSGLRMRNRREK